MKSRRFESQPAGQPPLFFRWPISRPSSFILSVDDSLPFPCIRKKLVHLQIWSANVTRRTTVPCVQHRISGMMATSKPREGLHPHLVPKRSPDIRVRGQEWTENRAISKKTKNSSEIKFSGTVRPSELMMRILASTVLDEVVTPSVRGCPFQIFLDAVISCFQLLPTRGNIRRSPRSYQTMPYPARCFIMSWGLPKVNYTIHSRPIALRAFTFVSHHLSIRSLRCRDLIRRDHARVVFGCLSLLINICCPSSV